MTKLTTHVLDIYSGKPGAKIKVELYYFNNNKREMKKIKTDVIGKRFDSKNYEVDNQKLISINEVIRYHPIELIGYELRESMIAMKKI